MAVLTRRSRRVITRRLRRRTRLRALWARLSCPCAPSVTAEARIMSALFGGYGLPLNGLLPAALAGGDSATYALADENTAPPKTDDALPADVVEHDGLIKARARIAAALPHAGAPERNARSPGRTSPHAATQAQAVAGRTWCGVEYGHAPGYAHSFFEARVEAAHPFASRLTQPPRPVRGRRAPRRPG